MKTEGADGKKHCRRNSSNVNLRVWAKRNSQMGLNLRDERSVVRYFIYLLIKSQKDVRLEYGVVVWG